MAARIAPIRELGPEGNWTEKHMYEEPQIQGRRMIRALLWACKLDRLRNTTLEHCCLAHSSLSPRRVQDILGLTLTLDCFSFKDLAVNELAFDLMLYLLTLTTGNDAKREVLLRLVSPEHRVEFERDFAGMELL